MKWSEMLLPTLKEDPAEAEAISHVLMIRAGLIRKLGSGVYTYLPLGLRVLKKIEFIIREEMNAKGAQEVLLPAIQPVELWMKSGRFEALGEDMITFFDRHKKINVLGPTHEEVVTSLIKNEVSSYRQLPLILYQIQTKFRDEARPRFGVMRSREFIMKDAYSFDRDEKGLNASYEKMYDAYMRIFTRCGLRFLPVEADTGVMGGDVSHEFMVLAQNGEDKVVRCSQCNFAASIDKAECAEPNQKTKTKNQKSGEKDCEEVSTPGVSSVKDVAEFLKVKPEQLVKTILYVNEGNPVAVLVRADYAVNETKLARVLRSKQLALADEALIKKVTSASVGFSGPVGLKGVEIVADYSLQGMKDFVVGANKADTHIINANLERDFKVTKWADVRSIEHEDLCPRCLKGEVEICQAIEVGHVFKLGTKYTNSLEAAFLDEEGKAREIIMGCYGIGVTRIIAASIEQNYDENGIIWPKEISPFQVLLMPLNPENNNIMAAANKIYAQLGERNIEVLFDDRNIRAGMKFKDADLIGIPFQIIIGEKKLAQNIIEIKLRNNFRRYDLPLENVCAKICELMNDDRKD
ncbi:MAG: proline--tRNA ligase [Candidatus Omnitrophica bacterium]|nr:proline--tRNA ligase [Candidatus Omnitrophota bacterium]